MIDLSDYMDIRLVDLLKSGNAAAFTEIYRRYASELYLLARNATGDRERSEDIVQEVFVSLWQRRHEADIVVLKGWLFQAVRFQVLKAYRQHQSNTVFQEKIKSLSQPLQQEDPALYRELQQTVFTALKSLPEDQLTIFQLHREEDLTYREISDRMGVSIKTVEKKMSLALSHLRSRIGETIVILILLMAH